MWADLPSPGSVTCTCIPLARTSHVTIPNCKGDWEMWCRRVSRPEAEGLGSGELLESKVIKCVRLLVYIANLSDTPSCSVQQEKKCRNLKEERNNLIVSPDQIFSTLY